MNRVVNILARVFRDRTALTLLLALGILSSIAILRPREKTGQHSDLFWHDKIHFHHGADLVIGGDSRVLCGVSPAAISEVLPELRVRNFAFPGCGYSQKYIDELHGVLHPSSRQPIIVLGISPASFMRVAAERKTGFFAELPRKSQPRPCVNLAAESLKAQLRPMPLRQIANWLQDPWNRTGYFQEFRADGWIASRRVPANPCAVVPLCRRDLRENQSDPEITASLLEAVRNWTSRGVRVYAVRLPISTELRDVEDELAGFDEVAFIAKLQEAGGAWLSIDQTGYLTGDGSHLERDSALRLSKCLAEAIRLDLKRNPSARSVAVSNAYQSEDRR